MILGYSPGIRFSTASLFAFITIFAVSLTWWLDAPRRSVERFREAIANREFQTANSFFIDRQNQFSDWGSGRTYFLTGHLDFGLGRRNAVYYEAGWWKNATIRWQAATFEDVLRGKRYFVFVGDDQHQYARLLFCVQNGSMRVFETNQPCYSAELRDYCSHVVN